MPGRARREKVTINHPALTSRCTQIMLEKADNLALSL